MRRIDRFTNVLKNTIVDDPKLVTSKRPWVQIYSYSSWMKNPQQLHILVNWKVYLIFNADNCLSNIDFFDYFGVD